MSKIIGDIETDKFTLEVYECECGMHVGLDVSYLLDVGPIAVACPNCKKLIESSVLEGEEECV